MSRLDPASDFFADTVAETKAVHGASICSAAQKHRPVAVDSGPTGEIVGRVIVRVAGGIVAVFVTGAGVTKTVVVERWNCKPLVTTSYITRSFGAYFTKARARIIHDRRVGNGRKDWRRDDRQREHSRAILEKTTTDGRDIGSSLNVLSSNED